MRVSVLVLDGVFDSGLAVVQDTLATANTLAEGGRRSRFEVTISGLSREAKTGYGHRVSLTKAQAKDAPDVVFVPGLACTGRDSLLARLDRPDVAQAGRLLARWLEAGAQILGACSATFVLAASGILNERTATTTWWLAPLFRERFPSVTLDDAKMVVQSGRVTTAGAALAHVDLALWLVRQRSPALAQATAKHLVFDGRPSQSAYVMPDHLAHADPVVERFEHWARRHLATFSLSAAAKHVGTSERTLERRIRAVLGRTPVSYVRDLRVEAAVHRLATTGASIDEIAASVGYADGVTLRSLLREKTGRGIRELRAQGG